MGGGLVLHVHRSEKLPKCQGNQEAALSQPTETNSVAREVPDHSVCVCVTLGIIGILLDFSGLPFRFVSQQGVPGTVQVWH